MESDTVYCESGDLPEEFRTAEADYGPSAEPSPPLKLLLLLSLQKKARAQVLHIYLSIALRTGRKKRLLSISFLVPVAN